MMGRRMTRGTQQAVGPESTEAVRVRPGRRRDLRAAAHEVVRHWDALQERIPAPVLRMLVTLPWLLRRMPVPFWVPLVFILLRRIAKHRARRAAKAARSAPES